MEKNRRYFVWFVFITVLVFQIAFFAALIFFRDQEMIWTDLWFHQLTPEEWSYMIETKETELQHNMGLLWIAFVSLMQFLADLIFLLLFWTRKPDIPAKGWKGWMFKEFLPISWKQKFAVVGAALAVGVPVTWYVQTHFWCYTPWVPMLSVEFRFLADLALVLIGLWELKNTQAVQ